MTLKELSVFHSQSKLLGQLIDMDGIQPDLGKVAVIVDMPVPNNGEI